MSGWHTKRDIIRDLNKVTNGIADIDIDDSYIVIGNEKPKRRIEDEFYDEDPRFEGVDLNHESGRTPDLDGIKKMLQMYNEYEEMRERERGVEAGCGDGGAPYVISKLNPLSAPFEPSGAATGPGGAATGPGGAAIGPGGAECRADEREIRYKIDQASLDTSRKGRTQKNVAIASLLKLHSRGSPGARPEPARGRHQPAGQPPPAADSVQLSIEKVNSWLNADPPTVASPTPSTPKSSPVPTGESMFKKKRTAKSTASTETDVKKRQPVTVGKAYKPSDYAENLRSRYIENNKPKKQPNENVWEKLERELKERDEKIMKERLNAEQQSRSSSENTAS